MSDSPVATRGGRGGRLVGGLAIGATLLGGIAAALQIRDSMVPKPPQPRVSPGVATPASEPVPQGVAGPAGARIVLPDGWSVVSRSVLEATVPGITRSLEANVDDVVFLEGPDVPGEASHLFGFFVYRDRPLAPDVETMVRDLRNLPECLMAEVRDTPSGGTAHSLEEQRMPDPDGVEVVARGEQFVWIKDGHMWALTFSSPAAAHFQYSDEFGLMADSVDLP